MKAVVIFFLWASVAHASATLNHLASVQADKRVSIHCVDKLPYEGEVSIVHGRPAHYAKILRIDCKLILTLITDRKLTSYRQFYAVDTLFHEATHMSGKPGWRNESFVECEALHSTAKFFYRMKIKFPFWWLRFEWKSQPKRFRDIFCPGFTES